MQSALFRATIVNMVLAALLWGLFGWLATVASTYAGVTVGPPREELRQLVDAYDKRILLKGIAAWGVVGAMSSLIVMFFYMTSPSLNAPRYALLFAILLGFADGLLFALWYYPRMDLTATSGSLASTPVRVTLSCFLAVLSSFMAAGWSVSRLRRLLWRFAAMKRERTNSCQQGNAVDGSPRHR